MHAFPVVKTCDVHQCILAHCILQCIYRNLQWMSDGLDRKSGFSGKERFKKSKKGCKERSELVWHRRERDPKACTAG